MSALPSTARSDLPMIPVPVFPHNANFLPPGGDNPAMLSGKGPATAGRGMQAGHLSAGPLPSQEPLQLISSDGLSKGRGDQAAGDATNEVAVDPSRLKFWSPEETLELIQLYKKYLPEFHKFGQRKMNVWQRVTEEMIAKGHSNFSWAECSAKFRSLRDSYRRTSAGGRAQTWQYYMVMKEVMKMEKMILDQEPATRGQKGTITCENDIPNPSALSFPSLSVPNSGLSTPAVPSGAMANTVMATAQHPSTSGADDATGEGTEADLEELSRKRVSLEAVSGPAAKKPKDSDQDGEVVIGRNFNGEPVRAKTRKPAGALGVLGSFQALGKSLTLPQSQLVVSDDGQIVQTTSTPTGLYVSDSGQLCSSQPGSGRQTTSMPQWFKMYEKRTRAENSRRLEELKEMHRDSLDLQRQTLEVARQKNELLKNLMDSLAEFKALLQR